MEINTLLQDKDRDKIVNEIPEKDRDRFIMFFNVLRYEHNKRSIKNEYRPDELSAIIPTIDYRSGSPDYEHKLKTMFKMCKYVTFGERIYYRYHYNIIDHYRKNIYDLRFETDVARIKLYPYGECCYIVRERLAQPDCDEDSPPIYSEPFPVFPGIFKDIDILCLSVFTGTMLCLAHQKTFHTK